MAKSRAKSAAAGNNKRAVTGDNSMWVNNTKASVGLFPGRRILGPLFLLLVPPPGVMLIWYCAAHLDGSFVELAKLLWNGGVFKTFVEICPSPFDATVWKMIGVFFAVELILARVLPGSEFKGPVTPKGNVPVYKANGVLAYVTTVVLFLVGALYFGVYNVGIIYDKLGGILSAVNVFSLLFCAVLYVKGRFAPSSTDSGTTGNPVFDYYWGTELYPRILGWDVKMMTNCRGGMMFWALAIISYAGKQFEIDGVVSDSMCVSVGLQLVYITKFFWWETGYLKSIDIMHDRAGFYICWGCLTFLPCIYTSHAFYLTTHPNELGAVASVAIAAVGCVAIWMNYDADVQRQTFRAANGKCNVWGRPARYVRALYATEDRQQKQSLLLRSGWWGLSRHFHYIPEVTAAVMWSVPGLFASFVPYLYVTILTMILIDRAYRDDARCRSKYGKYWTEYCRHVPNLILPKLF